MPLLERVFWSIETFFQQEIQRQTIPGAVVCVAHRGQVVWHRAYGMAALVPQQRPMRCNTLFDIASLTKVVATTSLLLRPITTVSVLWTIDCHASTRSSLIQLACVTLRHILTQRRVCRLVSALPGDLPGGPMSEGAATARERRRQAARSVLQRPLAYAPGTQTLQ